MGMRLTFAPALGSRAAGGGLVGPLIARSVKTSSVFGQATWASIRFDAGVTNHTETSAR